ncbi:MAG: hypothetical protein ACTHNW_18315 [Mucilaginibacter sp.]
MNFFPADRFAITSTLSFEQDIKRLNENFKDGYFNKVSNRSTYNTGDTFYFTVATRGKRAALGTTVRCVIKANANSPGCEVLCRIRLHPLYWCLIFFFTILTLGGFVSGHYIAPLLFLLGTYSFFLFSMHFDAQRVKQKLEAVFSGNATTLQ